MYPGAWTEGVWAGPEEELLEFETALVKLQLQTEDSFEAIARATGRPTVLVYDRGTMDVGAYMPAEIWDRLLARNGWYVADFQPCVSPRVFVSQLDGVDSKRQPLPQGPARVVCIEVCTL